MWGLQQNGLKRDNLLRFFNYMNLVVDAFELAYVTLYGSYIFSLRSLYQSTNTAISSNLCFIMNDHWIQPGSKLNKNLLTCTSLWSSNRGMPILQTCERSLDGAWSFCRGVFLAFFLPVQHALHLYLFWFHGLTSNLVSGDSLEELKSIPEMICTVLAGLSLP